jgi:o-succinylbenzoate synthase
MMRATYFKHILKFKIPSGTSRGILNQKESWFIIIKKENQIGIGECSIIRGLSPDSVAHIEKKLDFVCENIKLGFDELSKSLQSFPSILFGLETAYHSFNCKDPFLFKDSLFVLGENNIPINGLIWMGGFSEMKNQIKSKIEDGFDCIKIKVGSLDFDLECQLLKQVRNEFRESELILRLDANGAFKCKTALEKLKKLSDYNIHSIEQPISTKNWREMNNLCEKSPIDIALDEELIGVNSKSDKRNLLEIIKPAYIILKPSLVGGFQKSDCWISIAEELNIGWWSTSALESNVGLNAIAQWVINKTTAMHQGLGTGELFTNNIDCPLSVKDGKLHHEQNKNWNFNFFKKM